VTALDLITTAGAAQSLWEEIRGAGGFAFDTEFVSERTYRPRLALVQVATPNRVAAIDPLAIGDLEPLWALVADPAVTTIVHGGEQEARFCRLATSRVPAAYIDVQLAAGFAGLRFPMSYANLVERTLGSRPRQGQARTDWLRRPLTDSQLDYALEDVRHLHALWERLQEQLDGRQRRPWLDEENARRLAAVERGFTEVRWRRVSGAQKLNRRGLGIVRELSLWREAEAERRDQPRAWVLSDHLIVAIAESMPRSLDDVRRIRGLDRAKDGHASTLVTHVERALALPEDELPSKGRPPRKEAQVRMLGLLLEAVLESHCAEEAIDTSLVGGASDLRDLVRWHLNGQQGEAVPALLEGWRAELVGDLLERTLRGDVTVRVRDASAPDALTIESP